MPEGMDRTPLVDFCNQKRSASTTADLPSPGQRGGSRLPPPFRALSPSHAPAPRTNPPRGERACPCGTTLGTRSPRGPALSTTHCKQRAVIRAFRRQQPSVHGPGAVHEVADDATVLGRRLPCAAPKSTRDGSFAPTRSARAPPVVGPWQRRPESPAPPGARPACATCRTHATAIPPPQAQLAPGLPAILHDDVAPPLARRRSRVIARDRGPVRREENRGLLHPPLREEEPDPPHPRCLPSMGCPRARELSCPQVVDNLWMEPDASQSSRSTRSVLTDRAAAKARPSQSGPGTRPAHGGMGPQRPHRLLRSG